MSFVQRELDRVTTALREPSNGERHAELYAAQQALSWALEPLGFKAPFETIMGTQGGLEGCLEHIHPVLS